jgi:DDE family transposase
MLKFCNRKNFRRREQERTMEFTTLTPPAPGVGNGFSVVMAERILHQADVLGLSNDWAQLPLGHPSRRRTAYRSQHRIAAVLAGLAAGLKGVSPSNSVLRPNAALQTRLGGRFPDQGTIHRWLGGVTATQAAALRDHLHKAVRRHGRFREVLFSRHYLMVDIDGQGLAARGQRFGQAAVGHLGDGMDRGYQRYVAYAADTREVLDEFLAPGNKTLMSQLPQVLEGLDALLPRADRKRVILRLDAHGGTIANVRAMREHGYHYLCPLLSWAAIQRLRAHLQGKHGGWFDGSDSQGRVHRVQFWVLPRWQLTGRGRTKLSTRATVYHEPQPNGKHEWLVLLTDLKREKGRRLWQRYHERGGTIEEYNDQSERAYHLEVMRTSNFDGLNALHSLIGVCWNLTEWALEGLHLPPIQAPAAEVESWVAALGLDLAAVQQRAAQSGLRLYRVGAEAVLEVEDTAKTAESAAWCRWLQQPIQLRLRLAG